MPYQTTYPRPGTYFPLRNPALFFEILQTTLGRAAILLYQPAELFGAFDLHRERQHRRVVSILHRERPVAYRLMGPFDVVVALYKFIDQVLKMVLAEDDGCEAVPESFVDSDGGRHARTSARGRELPRRPRPRAGRPVHRPGRDRETRDTRRNRLCFTLKIGEKMHSACRDSLPSVSQKPLQRFGGVCSMKAIHSDHGMTRLLA